MVTKTLIVLLTVFCLLPVYGEDNPKGDIIVNGLWSELSRSLTPDIPISGKMSNGLLILTNERPDRNITFALTDNKGYSV